MQVKGNHALRKTEAFETQLSVVSENLQFSIWYNFFVNFWVAMWCLLLWFSVTLCGGYYST